MFWHLNREKGNLELSKTIGLNYRVWLNYIINVVILLSSSNVNNFIREIIYPLLTASIHSSSHELYFFIFIVILFFIFPLLFYFKLSIFFLISVMSSISIFCLFFFALSFYLSFSLYLFICILSILFFFIVNTWKCAWKPCYHMSTFAWLINNKLINVLLLLLLNEIYIVKTIYPRK